MSNEVSTEVMEGIEEQAENVLDHVEGDVPDQTPEERLQERVEQAQSVAEVLAAMMESRTVEFDNADWFPRLCEKQIAKLTAPPQPVGDISIGADFGQCQIPGEKKKPFKLVLELRNGDDAMRFLSRLDREAGVRIYGFTDQPDGQMSLDDIAQDTGTDDDDGEDSPAEEESEQELAPAAEAAEEAPESDSEPDPMAESYPPDAVRHETITVDEDRGGVESCLNCGAQVRSGHSFTQFFNEADEVVGCRH